MKSNKIGILTFWHSNDNYGQLLQCYALQAYFKQQGHQPILIRFIPIAKAGSKLDPQYFLSKLLNIKHVFAYVKYKIELIKSKQFRLKFPRYFDDFRNEHIQSTSKVYYSFQDLLNENWKGFDAFISGSDQVWSYYSVKENFNVFFLDFVPKGIRKIAYAASFGRNEIPEDYRQSLPNWLNEFNAVGLREDSGISICRNVSFHNAELVCDPTLLLSGNDYLSNIVCEEIDVNSSVFCYLLNWQTLFPKKEIEQFIHKHGLKMNFIPAQGAENNSYFTPMLDMSIPSWLKTMAASRFVFTNSFHGIVFAILLKKPFISFPLTGISSRMNDRQISLLTKLGLLDRVYSKDISINSLTEDGIDWNAVYKKLDIIRDSSKLFLENALADNE